VYLGFNEHIETSTGCCCRKARFPLTKSPQDGILNRNLLSSLNTNAALAKALLAGALLCSAAASATTITFSGLSGTNGDPVARYSESGYTMVTLIGGQFFEGSIS
jgi:hypothetical protein